MYNWGSAAQFCEVYSDYHLHLSALNTNFVDPHTRKASLSYTHPMHTFKSLPV